MSERKIVVLNSGGFDSVVMCHLVRELHPHDEVHSLFFDWKQLCLKSERECSHKCADKLGFIKKDFDLQYFDWGDSSITNGNSDSQYVPLRNLVFLSYALSYAEGIGADIVYVAFVKNPYGTYFEDSNPDFLGRVNALSDLFHIKVEAPFIDCCKNTVLLSYARLFGIAREEVHSCNFSNEPCGECPDCVALKEIFNEVDSHLIDDMVIDNDFQIDGRILSEMKSSPLPTGIKIYLNNDCQFHCRHCFIGNKELVGKPLSVDEWDSVLSQAYDMGVRNVDFFGKEPLYDDKVFSLMDSCRERGMSYSIVTNGVNVPKYISRLCEYKPHVVVSVESLSSLTDYRDGGNHLSEALSLLNDYDIPRSVSVDLSNSNVSDFSVLLDELYWLGVYTVYVKPLRPMGDSEDFLLNRLIDDRAILGAVKEASVRATNEKGMDITFSFSQMDLHRLCGDNELWNDYLGFCIDHRADNVDGVYFSFELYCHRWLDKFAITPDGYVLGCAADYYTDYGNNPNVRNGNSLLDIVLKERDNLSLENHIRAGCHFCHKYCIGRENFLRKHIDLRTPKV